MPGRASRSPAEAAFRSSGPPVDEAPAWGADAGPGTATEICWPSVTTAARFTTAGSVPGRRPPAASIASATRAPVRTVTSPGRATRPTTETTTVVDVRAASPTGGDFGAEVA